MWAKQSSNWGLGDGAYSKPKVDGIVPILRTCLPGIAWALLGPTWRTKEAIEGSMEVCLPMDAHA